MSFPIILFLLAIISIVLAYKSLLHLMKNDELKEAKKELKKGKVIFRQGSTLQTQSEE